MTQMAVAEGGAQVAPAATGFTFADVRRLAAELARNPFDDRKDILPEGLRKLTYDEYRKIRFRPEKSLWRQEGLPFEAQFFQRASFKDASLDKVVVNIVDTGRVARVPYKSDWFDFGHQTVTELPSDLGFAGFRLHYPLHRKEYHDEIVVFLGASYFRALGQHQHYGLSARGLAIDTGLSKPEEFPRFREFWLEKPSPHATEITVYALMDSPSAAGAYQFTIRPGLNTVVDVQAHVFMRQAVEKIGFAPLTSMFISSEGVTRFLDDFRPEIHDSDGLLLLTSQGEWLWRPLNNPTALRVSSFRDTNPRGFGLLQRDRHFDHYQDLEAVYEKRPNLWIEPVGNWGRGIVQLIEIPSDADWYDNIVAFWLPDEPTRPGQEWQLAYRMTFSLDPLALSPGGRTAATRVGRGGSGGVATESVTRTRKFVIDFVGGQLSRLNADTPINAVITTSSGIISNTAVQRNGLIKGWRVSFELAPDGVAPVELRCYLKSGDDALTETWNYQWHPN